MTDVARQAGVSVATVSYVLNGRAGVGAESKQRVLRAASDLGFRPNRLARGLRGRRTRVLGLLLANVSNPFYPDIAAGIVAAAAAEGYQVFLGHTNDSSEVQQREVEAMLDHRCDGLIFTTITDDDRALLEELLASGVPCVQTVRHIPGLEADYVGIDNEAGGHEIARHLIDLGYRDIAVIAGPQNSSASRDRFAGVHRALREGGIELPEDRFAQSDLTREGGHQAACRFLGGRAHPEAIVCGNDMIALGAIDAVIDCDLGVPSDVAITGFDDMPFASSRLVQLTTIRQPPEEFGSVSVRLLLDRLENPSLLPRQIILPHSLVIRRSCGAPPELRMKE
jgi:LacI family transcriptional regulator